jgi:pyruvate dehydrogenase E1 component alpha subunit
VWRTPNVFVIANNQWAISVPRKMQTGSETIAQKALAYGMRGIQVDGNDVLAVYRAVKEAADGVRGGGPAVLIECITYRMGPHTTADDPRRYRDEAEIQEWRAKDPIKRFQEYLRQKGLWNEEYEKKVQDESAAMVEKTVKEAEAYATDPKDIFRFLYSGMPKDLEAQMEECFGAKGVRP